MDEGVGRKGNGVIPGRCGDPGELRLAVAPSRGPSKNNRVEEEQKFDAVLWPVQQQLMWSGRLVTRRVGV